MSLCRKCEPGLTEFEGLTSTSIYDPSSKHEGRELKWKKESIVAYGTGRQNEVRKMLIKYVGN